MNIAVVGCGYVGLTSGTCFSEMGNTVLCIDVDKTKIKKLNKGKVPIFEPGLSSLISKNLNKTLFFSDDLPKALLKSEIVFIAVGTPMKENGEVDLQYFLKVAKEIGAHLEKNIIIVNKSTVPVGTADKVKEIIQKELDSRNISIHFEVVSNPEFLKEGTAINDFMKPDRIVIGANTDSVFEKMEQLYSPFFRTHDRFIRMDIRSSEMTKYAANAMLATKISFINEIAVICEKVGADVNQVRVGIGSDSRIGYNFMYPGAGYGGSCFPKDVKALHKIASDFGYETKLIAAVEEVNDVQKLIIAQKVIHRFGENLKNKTFAIWGLSFKPGTDDVREAPAIFVIKELLKKGAKIKVYDPKAIESARKFYLSALENITYFDSKYQVLENADALVLMTEWKEFRSPDFEEIKSKLNTPIIFDGRNQYHKFNLKEKGFEYYQIGKI
ncbi:MAG: UDP-glucose/GDP-mannose dehydrogenase family protein [Polaribacter sp.]|uniref:UDP-glucose dehydrogenase family protein n=1 Tax=Polaribacter sp. TaxID=1920175 RepID=UPI003BB0A37D